MESSFLEGIRSHTDGDMGYWWPGQCWVSGWTRTSRAFPASVTLWFYGQMDDKSMREKGGNSLFSGSETETDQT